MKFFQCSCFKNDAGETVVRDPWCCWHGDIEWPRSRLTMGDGHYEIKWPEPQHFNCRCFVEPIVPGQYFGKMEGI